MASMSDLPTEIYDELAKIIPAPPKVNHQGGRMYRIVHGTMHPHRYVENYSPYAHGSPDLPTLRTLRFVSQKFNRAARRVLFGCALITWDGGNQDLAIQNWLCSEASVVSCVTNLRLKFGVADQDFRTYSGDQSEDLRERKLQSTNVAAPSICEVLENLSLLESLEVVVGGPWQSSYETGRRDEVVRAVNGSMQLISSITSQLSDYFSSPKLATHLTTLRLALPCTYNFVEIERGTSATLWLQLKRFFLDVMDATGSGGSKDYTRWSWDDSDDDEEDDQAYPRSNVQLEHPNHEHMHGIFEIVSKCKNLDTLGIWGTHILDVDLLDWQPTSTGLKSLYLKRVKISAANLLRCITPCKDIPLSTSHFSALWMEDVDLTSGTWSEVFQFLAQMPNHWYLNPKDLSYTRDGASAGLKEYNNRPWENTSCLWSAHLPDEADLKRLVRRRIKEAGGRDMYPWGRYEQTVLW